jgi:hypothetical protein
MSSQDVFGMRAWKFACDGWEAILVGSVIEFDFGELCVFAGEEDPKTKAIQGLLFTYFRFRKE